MVNWPHNAHQHRFFCKTPQVFVNTASQCVFTVIRDEQRRARGLRMLGFPWAYAEVTKLVLKMSSSILFFAQFERSYYLRSFRSLFSIAATIYCCVRTAAIASYDDVGRSPAPQPIEMSLSKINSLCTSTILRCPRSYFFHFHPQKKFPKVFVFRRKCM